MVTEHFFDSREALIDALTAHCKDTLEQTAVRHGKAGFLVSGGSTPAPLYERLAHTALPWNQIEVAMVDERWVAPDSDSSNQRFIESSLLQGLASQAKFIAMKNDAPTAVQGLAQTTKAYQQMASNWDLAILGMGPDGHTASIFPHCTGLEQALDENSTQWLSAIKANKSKVTGDNLERMTLSMAGLLNCGQLVLLITGEDKLDVYRQARQSNDAKNTPISAVLNQSKAPVHVYWAA